MAFWTDSEIATLKSCLNCDMSIDDIADRLGRNSDSVRAKANRLESDKAPPNLTEVLSKNLSENLPKHFEAKPRPEAVSSGFMDEIAEMANAAGIARQPQAPRVECGWKGDEDVADLWARSEIRNARKIEQVKLSEKFTVDFPEDQPIALAFVSDQHINAGGAVDLARMRADAEYIRDTPNLYAVLMGDGVDNHLKIRAPMLNSTSPPSEQWSMFNFYLNIFSDKILAMCSGNHCAWSVEMAGIDMVKWLADKNKICYSPSAFRIEVGVGGHKYRVAARHQYRMNSTLNQTHAVKQWQRLGEEEFDVGAVGHHHEPASETLFYRGQDSWVCRPGSYQISTSYTRQYGYCSAYPTCPTVILWPRKREICGFSDMRKAGLMLRSLLH